MYTKSISQNWDNLHDLFHQTAIALTTSVRHHEINDPLITVFNYRLRIIPTSIQIIAFVLARLSTQTYHLPCALYD